VLRVLSKMIQTGGGSSFRALSTITQTGGGPVLVLGVAFSSNFHVARISLPSHSPLTFDM
jgi:hypothetical protein